LSRSASPLRDKALKIWIKSGKKKKLVDIADELGISPGMIRKWKHEYNWDAEPIKKPKGAPKGNKNAVGNSGGTGAPPENGFAVTHGLFRRFMPEELIDMAEEFEDKDPIDMLWDMVVIWHTKIIYSLKITFVKDKLDETKVLKKNKRQMDSEKVGKGENQRIETFETYIEEEWEYQHAWDKENSTMKSLATASREFRAAVRSFQAAAPENDERLLKLQAMQLNIDKTKVEIANIEKGKSSEVTVIFKGDNNLED
jgi:uncharacterized protein YjcR